MLFVYNSVVSIKIEVTLKTYIYYFKSTPFICLNAMFKSVLDACPHNLLYLIINLLYYLNQKSCCSSSTNNLGSIISSSFTSYLTLFVVNYTKSSPSWHSQVFMV